MSRGACRQASCGVSRVVREAKTTAATPTKAIGICEFFWDLMKGRPYVKNVSVSKNFAKCAHQLNKSIA